MTGSQNPRGRLQQVRTKSIRRHELDVTIPLQKQVDIYKDIFTEAAAGQQPPRHAGDIPAVRVGSVGGTGDSPRDW